MRQKLRKSVELEKIKKAAERKEKLKKAREEEERQKQRQEKLKEQESKRREKNKEKSTTKAGAAQGIDGGAAIAANTTDGRGVPASVGGRTEGKRGSLSKATAFAGNCASKKRGRKA